MQVFGIGIDNLSRHEVLNRIASWLERDQGFHRIATVGPEFLLMAEKNRAFRGALLSADLRVADGNESRVPIFCLKFSSSPKRDN